LTVSSCCSSPDCTANPPVDPRYRRVLWIALVLNAVMFAVEFGASWRSSSVSLMADSIDFFGDAGNYALSLAVLGMAMTNRAKAAVFKAACMGLFGLFVLAKAAWNVHTGTPPEALTMGTIGFVALAVNGGVTLMLYQFRTGDANMSSVWICSRNDAIGNVAVMLAALGVFGTGSAWPDLLVAAVMGVLALSGAWSVLRRARMELRSSTAAAPIPASTLASVAAPVQVVEFAKFERKADLGSPRH
jgi:Co/Zn/Cd efflux system component